MSECSESMARGSVRGLVSFNRRQEVAGRAGCQCEASPPRPHARHSRYLGPHLVSDLQGKFDVLLDENDRETAFAKPSQNGGNLGDDLRGKTPSDGSSNKINRGLVIKARQIASICCSPPESEPASCRCRSARRGNAAQTSSSDQSAGWPRARRAASVRFSKTLSEGNIRRPCGTRPTRRNEIASGDSPEMEW